MAWAEPRGRKWRAGWRDANGDKQYQSGFDDEETARTYGRDQEALIRHGHYVDPRAGSITLTEWVKLWARGLDLEPSTIENYRYHLTTFALPDLGHLALADLSPELIAAWEKEIPDDGYAVRTARKARSILATCLSDAVPHRIPRNPASRPRARGRKARRRIEQVARRRKQVLTPLQALLFAERVAALSCYDADFVKLVTIAWTGLRWSEALGLDPGLVGGATWDIDWKLYELKGKFYRSYPKDGSIRTIDVPPFLSKLITEHLETAQTRCRCANTDGLYCPGQRYCFLRSNGGHARRSTFARWQVRPAADGRFPERGGEKDPRPARPVLVDASASFPGLVLSSWPAAVPGEEFVPPSLNRTHRPRGLPVGSRSSRAELAAYAVAQGLAEDVVSGLSREDLLDRFVRGERAFASWLPIMTRLTPHGLRHIHETWMVEDGIPDVLREDRMGHTPEDAPRRTMRDHYTHVTDVMRARLVQTFQSRWEDALRGRREIADRLGVPSSVPIVNRLLSD